MLSIPGGVANVLSLSDDAVRSAVPPGIRSGLLQVRVRLRGTSASGAGRCIDDPTRASLGEACRGWRLDDTRGVPGRVVAWRPDRIGRYRCAPLGIALPAEGSFLRVIDATDTLVPTRSERIYALFERLEQNEALVGRNEELAGRNEQLEGEIGRLRAEIARLRGGQR